MTTIHEIQVDDFESGVIYEVELISANLDDNVTREVISSFSTDEDDLPPIIHQVQTKSAISPGKDVKIQTIISWLTNEPATTRIYWTKGIAGSEDPMTDETRLDTNYAKKHVAVITKFEPGTVYTFRAEAIDSGGNITISKTYTILTPRQQESVFQVIMNNMEKREQWIRWANMSVLVLIVVLAGNVVRKYCFVDGKEEVIIAGYAQDEDVPILADDVVFKARPLSSYVEGIAERNVFEEIHLEVAQENKMLPVAIPALEKKIKLIGILVDKDSKAIVEDLQEQQTHFLSRGDAIGSVLLEEVREDKVIFMYHNKRFEMSL